MKLGIDYYSIPNQTLVSRPPPVSPRREINVVCNTANTDSIALALRQIETESKKKRVNLYRRKTESKPIR